MVRQVECDDTKALRDRLVVQQVPILPAVRAGSVQAQQRHALPCFLEEDPIVELVVVEAGGSGRRSARSRLTPHPPLSHDLHRTMQRPRVLHRDERVAFEHEAGDAHQHREDIVIQRLGRMAQIPPPDVRAGAKTECARHTELRRHEPLHQPAALEADDAAIVAARERHRQR